MWKSGFVGTLLVAGLTPTTGCAQARSPAHAGILQAPGSEVRIRVMDAFAGAPLAATEVRVTSDNGIRCVQAPCPTDGATWTGRTDSTGLVTVPKSAFDVETWLETDDHGAVELTRGAAGDRSGAWQVDLFPKRLDDEGVAGTRGYKLIDGRTGAPLADRSMRVEFPSGEGLDATTNGLGYVFFPWDKAAFSTSGDPAAWVTVPGFRRTQLDFDAGARGTTLSIR